MTTVEIDCKYVLGLANASNDAKQLVQQQHTIAIIANIT